MGTGDDSITRSEHSDFGSPGSGAPTVASTGSYTDTAASEAFHSISRAYAPGLHARMASLGMIGARNRYATKRTTFHPVVVSPPGADGISDCTDIPHSPRCRLGIVGFVL